MSRRKPRKHNMDQRKGIRADEAMPQEQGRKGFDIRNISFLIIPVSAVVLAFLSSLLSWTPRIVIQTNIMLSLIFYIVWIVRSSLPEAEREDGAGGEELSPEEGI